MWITPPQMVAYFIKVSKGESFSERQMLQSYVTFVEGEASHSSYAHSKGEDYTAMNIWRLESWVPFADCPPHLPKKGKIIF